MTSPRLGVWWLCAAGLVLGVGIMVVDGSRLRTGGYVVAGSLAAAALLRLLLPRRLAGGLQVRSRAVDVLTLAGLAVAVGVLVTVVDLRPR